MICRIYRSYARKNPIPGFFGLAGGLLAFFVTCPSPAAAGAYLQSAHGDSSSGVNRTGISGYSTGNCVHCHEQHGSISGSEPDPAGGGPSVFTLFADNFNDNAQSGPYLKTDNFCFHCHVTTGSQQEGGGITNNQYANTFAGYNLVSASDILQAFNLYSYHNLYDIKTFAEANFDFFSADSNPCAACHNPHLSRRNKANPSNPSFSAISRPADHEELWGDDPGERMSAYSSSYRAPYYYGSANTTHEPGGTLTEDGSNLPDYNTFCLDCHQYEVPVTSGTTSMNPNTPAGHLTAIDWGPSGDMHGQRPRIHAIDGSPGGFGSVTGPYNEAPVASNYVTSCLDCHEPHGTGLSSYLLRREVNNHEIDTGCGFDCGGPDPEDFSEKEFCMSCHTWNHCGGVDGCFKCHYHGAENEPCGSPWTGPNF